MNDRFVESIGNAQFYTEQQLNEFYRNWDPKTVKLLIHTNLHLFDGGGRTRFCPVNGKGLIAIPVPKGEKDIPPEIIETLIEKYK